MDAALEASADASTGLEHGSISDGPGAGRERLEPVEAFPRVEASGSPRLTPREMGRPLPAIIAGGGGARTDRWPPPALDERAGSLALASPAGRGAAAAREPRRAPARHRRRARHGRACGVPPPTGGARAGAAREHAADGAAARLDPCPGHAGERPRARPAGRREPARAAPSRTRHPIALGAPRRDRRRRVQSDARARARERTRSEARTTTRTRPSARGRARPCAEPARATIAPEHPPWSLRSRRQSQGARRHRAAFHQCMHGLREHDTETFPMKCLSFRCNVGVFSVLPEKSFPIKRRSRRSASKPEALAFAPPSWKRFSPTETLRTARRIARWHCAMQHASFEPRSFAQA